MSDHSDPMTAESTPTGPGLVSSSSAPAPNQVSSAWAQSEDRDEAAAGQATASADQQVATIELTDIEARVLGAMIEKSFLTPDVYPMTTNALTNACNQKTNRDPVVDYSAVQVDATLLELRQRNLVRRVHSQGSRATKHRQTLEEALSLSEPELALMSVLLLRGDQTLGELRIRTERHDVGFGDIGAIDDCLEALASRPRPLVRELPRQPGHKENRWRHLISDPHAASAEPDRTPEPAPAVSLEHSASPAAPAHSASPTAPAHAPVAPDGMTSARIDQLEKKVSTLQRQLASLAAKLGESLDDLA